MAHHPRQFGVAPDNLSNIYDYGHRFSSVEQPLPQEVTFQIQQARERLQAESMADLAHGRAAEAEWSSRFTFGPVTKPVNNTLLGYKLILKQGEGAGSVQFNPKIYGVFDRVIVNKSGVDKSGISRSPAFNPQNPYYDTYAPLRRNLAMLRNYLLATELPDGKFTPGKSARDDKEDIRNLAAIRHMAERLGDALAGPPPPKTLFGRWCVTMKRLITFKDLSAPQTSAFLAAANVPDRGAEMMYNYLLGLKKNPGFLSWIPTASNARNWPLLPIEQTPFSEENMQKYSAASIIEGCANEIERNVVQLRSVDVLSLDHKRIAVDEAEKILRNLRVLLGNDKALSELGLHNPTEMKLSEVTDTAQEETRLMMSVIRAFKETYGDVAAFDRTLLARNPAIEDAVNAIEMIGYRVKVEAQVALASAGEREGAKRMGQRIAKTPQLKNEIPLKDLVSKLENGLKTVSTIRQSIPPARLAEAQGMRAQVQAQMQMLAAQQAARNARTRQNAAKANAEVMTRARVTQTNNQAALQLAEHLEQERRLKEQQQQSQRKGPQK